MRISFSIAYLVVALVHRWPLQSAVALLVRALAVVVPSSLLHNALDQASNHIPPAEQNSVKYDELYHVYCKCLQIDPDVPNCMLQLASVVAATNAAFAEFAASIRLVSSFEVIFLPQSFHRLFVVVGLASLIHPLQMQYIHKSSEWFSLIRYSKFYFKTVFLNLPVCFLKTGIRPINGNFLPVIVIVVFFAAFGLSAEFALFLSDFTSFFSKRRSRDLERE